MIEKSVEKISKAENELTSLIIGLKRKDVIVSKNTQKLINSTFVYFNIIYMCNDIVMDLYNKESLLEMAEGLSIVNKGSYNKLKERIINNLLESVHEFVNSNKPI